MSRAGKFIPGGAGNKAGEGARTGPIRAPEPGAPTPDPGSSKKTSVKGSSLIKPVAKGQRLPIAIMSAVVCFLLVSAGWYILAVLPAKRGTAAMQQQLDAAIAAQKQAQEDSAKREAAEAQQQAAARATLTVDSKPTGASVAIGSLQMPTPATFKDLLPGTVTVVIQADGYEDYKQDVTVAVDKPTDLGTIELTQKTGSLSVTSPQSDVEYSLTGPGDYSHQGQVPDKLEKLPLGDYQLTVWQHDWKLPPVSVTIHSRENVQKEIKFPYASVSITSIPSGATVRQGRDILGKTPLSLTQLRPSDLHLSVDLPPYTVQRFDLQVPDSGNIAKEIRLVREKDFIAACGMPMVWIATDDGGFWAGKYDVRQGEFETVAGYNPSFFRRPNRPVEQISWESAMAFCEKLNEYERKAGKLPAGYHYTLPTESQWSLFSADADIDQAPMSRSTTLSSTQDAGASEPNKYGLYDTLGNVWEWCLDAYDDKGDHSLRGGSWLSSSENFPGAETRQAGAPKYMDKFTGFRVVLVPQ